MKVTCHPLLGGASRTGGGGHRNTGLSVLFKDTAEKSGCLIFG